MSEMKSILSEGNFYHFLIHNPLICLTPWDGLQHAYAHLPLCRTNWKIFGQKIGIVKSSSNFPYHIARRFGGNLNLAVGYYIN